MNFTLSIPCITIQLLQFMPKNAHTVLELQKYYNKHQLLHVQALLAHHH